MNHFVNRRDFLQAGSAMGVAVGFLGRPIRCLAAAETAQGATHAERLGWRLACNAYTFNRLTFYETIGKVASLGLKGVVGFNWQKLDPKNPDAVFSERMSATQRQEMKKRLGDAGVKLAGCYCGQLAEEGACRRLFDFAREMGIEILDGEPPPAAYDMLEKLCDEYQLNLGVHNHARPSPYWNPETLLKILQGRSKRLGACCDTGHWVRSGLNPVETLRKLQGRILTFDLKDVNEKGVCVPFGTGKADIGGILKELHRQRFRGVFGIEYEGLPTDAELAQNIAFFNDTAERLAAVK
jgi:sugar phosphate isomerase/epimerase